MNEPTLPFPTRHCKTEKNKIPLKIKIVIKIEIKFREEESEEPNSLNMDNEQKWKN